MKNLLNDRHHRFIIPPTCWSNGNGGTAHLKPQFNVWRDKSHISRLRNPFLITQMQHILQAIDNIEKLLKPKNKDTTSHRDDPYRYQQCLIPYPNMHRQKSCKHYCELQGTILNVFDDCPTLLFEEIGMKSTIQNQF